MGYAEGTKVTVASSRGEITGILAKHGCERMAWGTEPDGDTLQFALGDRWFRFVIKKPTWSDLSSRYVYDRSESQRATAVEAEWRRRWRAHVLLIKAKLEFIEGGDTTLEREFLPYAVLSTGQTLGEFIEGGGVPLLTSGG